MGLGSRRRRYSRKYIQRTGRSSGQNMRITESGINDSIGTGRDGIQRRAIGEAPREFLRGIYKDQARGAPFTMSVTDPETYFSAIIRADEDRNEPIHATQSKLRNNQLFRRLVGFYNKHTPPNSDVKRMFNSLVGQYWHNMSVEDIGKLIKSLSGYAKRISTGDISTTRGYRDLDETINKLYNARYTKDITRDVRELFDGTNPWKEIGDGSGYVNRGGQLLGARVSVYKN